MRASTLLNKTLKVTGATVTAVRVTAAGEVIVEVRRRQRLHRCPCGMKTAARYDARVRRWRHLDMAACKVFIVAQIARLDCRRCGRIRTEDVAWARPGARSTRAFEAKIAWLAKEMSKAKVAALMRCTWATVDDVVVRVVTDHLHVLGPDGGPDGAVAPLRDLRRIGVDEISYRRGHKYLTVVADHDSGHVVWVSQGRSRAALESFFDALGSRSRHIEAASCDASSVYLHVLRERLPDARICMDAFHVVQWCNDALDIQYRSLPALTELERVALTRRAFGPGHPTVNGTRLWSMIRTSIRTGRQRLSWRQQRLLRDLRRRDRHMSRCHQLKEELRDLFGSTPPHLARRACLQWLRRLRRSNIPVMVTLARRIQRVLDEVIATLEVGISNSRLEGINSKIRVIQRRGYGFPKASSLIAMIHLILGGISVELPT